MTSSTATVKVLFVCLGNICRSPSAEAVFRAQVEKAGLQKQILVDSCGTSDWHIGEAPDKRSQQAALRRGYDMTKLRGRQLQESDFETFDYILAMDEENLHNIRKLVVKSVQTLPHISLFLDFDSDNNVQEVPDPYYGGKDGFEQVLDLIESAAEGLLQHIKLKQLA